MSSWIKLGYSSLHGPDLSYRTHYLAQILPKIPVPFKEPPLAAVTLTRVLPFFHLLQTLHIMIGLLNIGFSVIFWTGPGASWEIRDIYFPFWFGAMVNKWLFISVSQYFLPVLSAANIKWCVMIVLGTAQNKSVVINFWILCLHNFSYVNIIKNHHHVRLNIVLVFFIVHIFRIHVHFLWEAPQSRPSRFLIFFLIQQDNMF